MRGTFGGEIDPREAYPEAIEEPVCGHCGGRNIEPLEMFRTIWECYDCGKTFQEKQ